jgi:hypothetical protein
LPVFGLSWAAAASLLAVVPAGYFDMNRASLNEELDGLIHLHVRIGWAVVVAVIVLALMAVAPAGPGKSQARRAVPD